MSDQQPGEPSPTPPPPPPPPSPAPPVLDYPSRPPTSEPETEQWSEIARAMLIVLSALAAFFFATFGLCGLLGRGCG
jgi:hypothetical protein